MNALRFSCLFAAFSSMLATSFGYADDDVEKTKELLIGVWKLPKINKDYLEFTKDGKVLLKGFTEDVKGTYKVIGKNKIQIEYTSGPVTMKGKKQDAATIEVTKDTLKFDSNLFDDKPNPNATARVRWRKRRRSDKRSISSESDLVLNGSHFPAPRSVFRGATSSMPFGD